MSDKQKLWYARVVETRTYVVDYVIDAETQEEATEKAMRGETVEETEIEFDGVQDREIDDDPVPHKPAPVRRKK